MTIRRKRRSKAEMVLARANEGTPWEVEPIELPYINRTGRNVFTTKGRCMAGETVLLFEHEGDESRLEKL